MLMQVKIEFDGQNVATSRVTILDILAAHTSHKKLARVNKRVSN